MIFLHKSFDFNYLRKQPLKLIMRLLIKLIEQQEKEKAFKIWLVKYQNMTKDNFKTFDEFWDDIIGQKEVQSNKSHDEILEDVDSILHQFKGGH